MCASFLGGDVEEEVSHIFEKERLQAEPFPLTAKSMEQVSHFLSQTHKKHFYARSNHITPCHHHSLGQSFACPQYHFGNNVGKKSVFLKAISPVNSICIPPPLYSSLTLHSSYPLLPRHSTPIPPFFHFSLQASASLNVVFSGV